MCEVEQSSSCISLNSQVTHSRQSQQWSNSSLADYLYLVCIWRGGERGGEAEGRGEERQRRGERGEEGRGEPINRFLW